MSDPSLLVVASRSDSFEFSLNKSASGGDRPVSVSSSSSTSSSSGAVVASVMPHSVQIVFAGKDIGTPKNVASGGVLASEDDLHLRARKLDSCVIVNEGICRAFHRFYFAGPHDNFFFDNANATDAGVRRALGYPECCVVDGFVESSQRLFREFVEDFVPGSLFEEVRAAELDS